eukprot:jgi/Botrbrau1/16030/Bobra.7_2s0004.2
MQRRFPRAKVYVAEKQWSWPLNLPLPVLGIFGAKNLIDNAPDAPWAREMDVQVLSHSIGIAPYTEAVMFHRRTKTLLVIDAVVCIPNDPPEVLNRAKLQRSGKDNLFVKLLYSKDKPVNVNSIDEQERLGWARMALLVLFFSPEHLREPRTFATIRNTLLVAPVLQVLVFSKVGLRGRSLSPSAEL